MLQPHVMAHLLEDYDDLIHSLKTLRDRLASSRAPWLNLRLLLDSREFTSDTKGLKVDVITTSDAAKRSRLLLPQTPLSFEDSQLLLGLLSRLLENRAETAVVNTATSAVQIPNMEGNQPDVMQLSRVTLEVLSSSSCGVETQPKEDDVQRAKVKGDEKADELQPEDEGQRDNVKGVEMADQVQPENEVKVQGVEADAAQTEDEGQRDKVKGVEKANEMQRLVEDEGQRDKVEGVEEADELQTEEVKVKVEIGQAPNSPSKTSASRGAYFAGLVFG